MHVIINILIIADRVAAIVVFRNLNIEYCGAVTEFVVL
jgi:hypothetical protein